jgi:hypothetical protein
MAKKSEHKDCKCEVENSNHVYIDTIELNDGALESLLGFYCISCNSFWREV